MKAKMLKRTGSFLLVLVLMASLLPDNSISAEAATPTWIPNSITANKDAGWSSRMQYTGIADAAGKDWSVEFDIVSDGCAIGVYQYDATGAMYCAYLDTNNGVLDSVRYDDWTTCKDGFYFSEGLPGEAMATNWTEADKAKSHIRMDFIRGSGGTMAGGTVRYYKKDLTSGQYVDLGRLAVSSDLKDDAAEPNRFGIHLILGKATISNMKVVERGTTDWVHATDSEKQIGAATYNKATDTITLANDDGWNSRMVYLGAPDVAGKAFALEFNAEWSVGGALGVMPFYEDSENFYGVFLDRTAKLIDGAGYSGGQIIDDFDYIDASYYAANPVQKFPLINWVRYRFEFFPGPGGTAVGGTCKLYYKTMTDGQIRDDFWRLIGTFNLPTTVRDSAGKPNKIMVCARLMSATLNDIVYTEISPDTVTEYYNGPGEAEPEDGYAKDGDPLPIEPEPEIAGEVAPQSLADGGYGITTGGFTLQLYATKTGFGTQITDANGVVVQEQVNPINIQIKKPNAADDYLGTKAETEMLAADYRTVRQQGNTLIATAQVVSNAGSRFVVTDKYIGLKAGGFQMSRNIRVVSAATEDEGFNSIVKFKEKNPTTYDGYEYFMPSILYRDSNNLPAGAIGKDLSLDYTWVRDNLMPTPLVMARNKASGNSFAMGRVIDEEIYTGIDETLGSWVVSKYLDYSSTGFSNVDGYVSLDLCYPGMEGNVNNLTWAIPFLRRSHPVQTDVVHSYRVLLQPNKTESFTDAVVEAYKGQFNANTVPEVEADIEKVYDVTLDYFNDFTQEYTSGRVGMPFAQYLDGEVASLDSLIGFVGQQTTVGFHLIRNGIATNDAKQRQKG